MSLQKNYCRLTTTDHLSYEQAQTNLIMIILVNSKSSVKSFTG